MNGINGPEDMLQSFFKLIKLAVFLVFCFVILKAYSAWLKNSDSFKIRKIEIHGNELVSEKKIMSETQLDPEKRIWEIDLGLVDSTIRNNPLIERVQLERSFPNVLKIRIYEKYPIALINYKNRFYCIDREGLVLPSKPGRLYDLPVISGRYKGIVQVGHRIHDPAIQKGLTFIETLIQERAQLYTELSEIVIQEDQNLLLYTRQGGVPVRLGEGGYRWKIRYLEAIIHFLVQKSEINRVRYIDLRYENQIVVGERA